MKAITEESFAAVRLGRDRTAVVEVRRQEVTQVDRRRTLRFIRSGAQPVRVWENLPGRRRGNHQDLWNSVRTLFSDVVQHRGGLSRQRP